MKLALTEGEAPRLGWREGWRAQSFVAKAWWISGAVLLGLYVLGRLAGAGCIWGPAVFFFIAWLIPNVFVFLGWIWDKLTYRVSVRLFLSYLLVGILPFLLIGLLATAGVYAFIGQFTSSEFANLLDRLEDALQREVDTALDAAAKGGARAGREALAHGPRFSEGFEEVAGSTHWIFADGERSWASEGLREADAVPPAWLGERMGGHVQLTNGRPALVVAARRGEHLAAAILHLDDEAAAIVSRGHWYAVKFVQAEGKVQKRGFQIGSRGHDGDEDSGEDSDEDESGSDEGESPLWDNGLAAGAEGFWNRLWNHRWIFFVHFSEEPLAWSDGRVRRDRTYTTIVRTSPREASAYLFRSPFDLGRGVWAGFAIVGTLLVTLYAIAGSLAVFMIVAITRSTARLTAGTREVQAGHLDYRIPVKRRDQLGDLAVTFNKMTESVASMLGEVAEKERLKQELGLAREIQQSLLPANELQHGGIAVRAYFRPAAEVGGDYFDLFPLEKGRLIVAAGDVAGHGLSTGLLMAMVKSAVATLIQEGHRGPDLLERLNKFMLQQPREHRMVTLALAEINTVEGFAEITNAAHPPVYIAFGEVREVMLPALPVGTTWRRRPPSERLELAPGSRLVFYSDGLVEAANPDDDQFGYERLKKHLEDNADASSEELMASLLAAMEKHTDGRPLDDDLTILIIDCNPG